MAIKNQLSFPTPASILYFQILFPNTRKSTTYKPHNKTCLPNTATISATKSKIFQDFFNFFEEFSDKTKHFYNNSASEDLEQNPTTMHCNAKRYPLLLGEKEREEQCLSYPQLYSYRIILNQRTKPVIYTFICML